MSDNNNSLSIAAHEISTGEKFDTPSANVEAWGDTIKLYVYSDEASPTIEVDPAAIVALADKLRPYVEAKKAAVNVEAERDRLAGVVTTYTDDVEAAERALEDVRWAERDAIDRVAAAENFLQDERAALKMAQDKLAAFVAKHGTRDTSDDLVWRGTRYVLTDVGREWAAENPDDVHPFPSPDDEYAVPCDTCYKAV
jgi:hypothetical protein